mgnify:CR=1 FL=1
MSLRIGVVGTGVMGADHARTLNLSVHGASVTVLADPDLDRARQASRSIDGARAVADAHELVAADDVDAIVIASGDALHVEHVTAALAAGKPIMCEQPLAPTAEECRALMRREEEVTEGGANLISVGFMRRFDPGYVELRALIEQGELGVPLQVHSVGRGVSAPAGTDELTIHGSAIHDLDIVPWLLGSPVVEVAWHSGRQSPEVADRHDPVFLLLRHADGALSTVDVFLNARYGYDIRCEVVGSQSSASLVEPRRVVRDTGLGRSRGYAADWRPRFADAYRQELTAWVGSIVHGTPSPLAAADDALQAALVADAAVMSMHAGGAFVAVGEP